MLVPILTPDIEVDIESELSAGDFRHAIPVCVHHRGPEFFPHIGAIVESVCGKLFRWQSHSPDAEKCSRCADFNGKWFNCYYCGKKVHG